MGQCSECGCQPVRLVYLFVLNCTASNTGVCTTLYWFVPQADGGPNLNTAVRRESGTEGALWRVTRRLSAAVGWFRCHCRTNSATWYERPATEPEGTPVDDGLTLERRRRGAGGDHRRTIRSDPANRPIDRELSERLGLAILEFQSRPSRLQRVRSARTDHPIRARWDKRAAVLQAVSPGNLP